MSQRTDTPVTILSAAGADFDRALQREIAAAGAELVSLFLRSGKPSAELHYDCTCGCGLSHVVLLLPETQKAAAPATEAAA